MVERTQGNAGSAPSGAWNATQREFVRERQEDAYRALGESLGLGDDPAKTFEATSGPRMPLEHLSSDKFKAALGSQLRFSADEWAAFEDTVAQTHGRYFTPEPPTPFEDANRFASMSMTFDAVYLEYVENIQPIEPPPLLATLPSGDISARIMIEPETLAPIIFFEHGLFDFFYEFACWVGWVVPPFAAEQLFNDAALTTPPQRRYTMPPQSSQALGEMMQRFLTGAAGSSQGTARSKPPPHNLVLVMRLLVEMERFVMAHELVHIASGHMNQDPQNAQESQQMEHDADSLATMLLTRIGQRQHGSWAFQFWACDVALSAFALLMRALGLLHFGTTDLRWISSSHPDPIARRAVNRRAPAHLAKALSPAGLAASSELCGMSDALFSRQAEIVLTPLLIAHRHGMRPSQRWSRTISRSLAMR